MKKRVLEHLIPFELDFQCESARIMVIDDDSLITRFVKVCLKNAGFESVTSLNDSTAALEKIRACKPDLVLLDIEMPQISGLELLAEIRDADDLGEVIVVMLSGADKASKYKSLNLGAVDFIDKPVQPDELEIRIRKALRVV